MHRWKLNAAVGLRQLNHPRDVRIVQRLLNRARIDDPKVVALVEDGVFGPLTAARLLEFQQTEAHLQRPDGVVAVNGPTSQALAGVGSAPAVPAAGPIVRPAPPIQSAQPAAPPSPAKPPGPPPLAVDQDRGLHALMLRRAAASKPAFKSAWFNRALPAAARVKATWGVPIAVTLAQGALESNWGRAAPGNVYFGVKGKSPGGQTIQVATHEVRAGLTQAEVDGFRAYDSLEESAEDYGRFLATNRRYSHAFNYRGDPDMFIHMVALAGYATDPKYETKIKSIMATNGLKDYDAPGATATLRFSNAAHELGYP